MYSSKDSLKISTILEFMILARNSLEATVEKYTPGVKYIKNNIYVSSYELQFNNGSILLLWRNPGGRNYWISYKNPSFKYSFFRRVLNKIKSSFSKDMNFSTNCEYHALASIETIFEDFKKEYEISADFDSLLSKKDALYKILYEIHHNFFYIIKNIC